MKEMLGCCSDGTEGSHTFTLKVGTPLLPRPVQWNPPFTPRPPMQVSDGGYDVTWPLRAESDLQEREWKMSFLQVPSIAVFPSRV